MRKVIDLTQPFVHGENIEARLQEDLPVYCGHECCAWDLAVKSHTGTYFETASHVLRDGGDTVSVPPEHLFMPCCVVRLGGDRHGVVEPEEMEAAPGGEELREGDALLVAASGNDDRYWSRASAEWMGARKVRLFGAEPSSYDTGFENPTGFFVPLFEAGIPIVANLTNWGELPEGRCELVVMPLLVKGVCTVPARVVVLLD